MSAARLAELHVAGLGHEAIDHTMEHNAVISAFARQFLDTRNVIRREIRIKLQNDIALGGFKNERVFRVFVSHWASPCIYFLVA